MKGGRVAIIDDETRRRLGRWVIACARRTLPLFEAEAPTDLRPRAAIAGGRAFVRGARRTAELRRLVWAAYAAARAVASPAAAAAARAAGLVAGLPYIHTEVTAPQMKHVFGPAAYAVRARELAAGDDTRAAARELARALALAGPEVRRIVRRLPRVAAGHGRLGELMRALEAGLRRD